MQRTQIYLTEHEQDAIRKIGIRTGRSQSALIREAIDQFIAVQDQPEAKTGKRMAAFGIWQDRHDAPSLQELRSEERFTGPA